MNKNKLISLLLAAVICLAHGLRAYSQNKVEFNSLIFHIPQGLSVSKTDNNMVLTDAVGGNGQNFTITVNRPSFSLKKIEKGFPVFWRESLLNEGVDNPAVEPTFVKAQTNSGWNCFRGGKLVQYSAQTPSFYYHLTVMRYAGITLRIVTRAGNEEIFMQKIPLLMQLVTSVNFKPQQQVPNSYPPASTNQNYPGSQVGSTYPTPGESTVLNGLFISVDGDLLSNAELAVLHFSAGGTVYTDIPEKGFYNLNIPDLKTQYPALFGSYTAMNNTISVKMNNQSNPTSYTIDAEGIRAAANPAKLFKKIETLDSYRFEGTFIARQNIVAATIVFNTNGQFTDNGLIKSISGGSESFSAGNGTYTSRQNSLLLQYADGRNVQLCFYMMPEDFRKATRPDKLLIGNYLLVRQ